LVRMKGSMEGGIRGDETVVGEAGGLPLDTRTASRSAAPGNTLFLCARSTNTHRFYRYILGGTHFFTLEELTRVRKASRARVPSHAASIGPMRYRYHA